MTKLKLALRLAWCAIAHDVRQRQGAYRCWVCSPLRHHTAKSRAEFLEAVGEEHHANA